MQAIHTARSRNDQVLVDFKIWMNHSNDKLIKLLNLTINNILKIAEKNIYTIMPGFTHLKTLNQFLLHITFQLMLKCLEEIKKD